MFGLKKIMAATAGALLVFALTPATESHAATITTIGGVAEESCSIANFTVSDACNGSFSVANPGGNVAGGDLNPLFFADGVGITGWSQIDKTNTTSGGGTFTGENNLFKITTSDNATGNWELISPFAFLASKYYIFALKGATEQVAYFMDGSTLQGTWNNTDLGFFNPGGQFTTPGLSNISLFEADGATVIPLPAGGLLLITALGGLGFVARRRRKAA